MLPHPAYLSDYLTSTPSRHGHARTCCSQTLMARESASMKAAQEARLVPMCASSHAQAMACIVQHGEKLVSLRKLCLASRTGSLGQLCATLCVSDMRGEERKITDAYGMIAYPVGNDREPELSI